MLLGQEASNKSCVLPGLFVRGSDCTRSAGGLELRYKNHQIVSFAISTVDLHNHFA